MWIDETALEADIAKFLPLVKTVAQLIPGTLGNTIVAALTALTDPAVIGPVVALINQLTGAKAPTS
jgi:hypothetical protein